MITPVNHTLINEHIGLYSGGTALIVLGGASAKQWLRYTPTSTPTY